MGDSQVSTQEGPSVACPSPTKDKTDSTDENGRKGLTARLRTTRSPRRPRLWFEILLIGVSYWLYSLVRNAVPEQRTAALRNADWVWSFENSIGAGFEHSVNHAVNSVTWLIVSMNYYYATLHFIVTIAVLVWLFRRHPGRYAATRLVLFATTGVALLGYYLVPLAPPRLMNGGSFVDTVLVHHTWGSMASGNLKNMSNQYAAMPSMHIGWSLWCGLTIFALASVPWVRVLGLLYPLVTLTVIVSTANHFWLDAVGGVVCLGFGFAVASLVYGTLPYRLPRRVEPPRTPLRTRLVGLGTDRGAGAVGRAARWSSHRAGNTTAVPPVPGPSAAPSAVPEASPRSGS
ncbi:phosphatase PAP2 family protein [Streptomyces sp. NPDC060184]|uniref:phosphatase PAP2 family protein n=1 Tax=Streptomyces sp. NPDC060184 TaxID=3347064 RepID=UPI003648F205